MKQVVFLLLAILLTILSCSKVDESDGLGQCSDLKSNDVWQTYPFKPKYTIQYPDSFIGGMIFFEGPIFNLRTPNNSIIMEYSYCGGNYCSEFDEINKQNSCPHQYNINIGGVNTRIGDITIHYCAQNQNNFSFTYGIIDSMGYGRLNYYFNIEDYSGYYDALDIRFEPNQLALVQDIIQTIRYVE